VDLGAGYTILHKCEGLARALGLRNLYVKDDTVTGNGLKAADTILNSVTKPVEIEPSLESLEKFLN